MKIAPSLNSSYSPTARDETSRASARPVNTTESQAVDANKQPLDPHRRKRLGATSSIFARAWGMM
ncbi:hypothetical protein [Burkholderia sp. HI2714]|uniref:hypothetical protein n=1 Tax=Burkholderia sp. HI2714 TaxID=2015359 RepID=UPI00117C5EFD|nr:hypothetical protein [Burkholderia sp. HI2714]